MHRKWACLSAFAAACASLIAASTEWPHYGNDADGTRYSPLSHINKDNVSKLQVAWTYRTGALDPQSRANQKAAFEATPIMVGGTLYLSTPLNQVIALDAETGKPRWVYDPKIDRNANYSEITSRGVSAWRDEKSEAGKPCRARIFMGTIDARLIALDAATGKPCVDFGKRGQVDLSQGVGLKDRGDYQVTSPPVVVQDIVIAGSSIGDNRRFDVESGVVRAFDARTGRQRWSWDPLPDAQGSGGANAWAPMSPDPARDLVFVPTGSPSPDFFGGRRPGNNLYANSVVALRASTGERVWHFQVVHHDLWDYDVAAQPSLITVRLAGVDTPAVAVNTKMGHYFLLHRETGKPLLPVEEKSVPQTDVEGERTSGTQPFPKNPALVPQRLRPEDAWGVGAEDREWCRQRISELRSEGMFTPPSLRGSILFPGNAGGVAWGGAAFHPDRGLMLVNTNRFPTVVRLIPRERFPEEVRDGERNRLSGEFGRQEGTPFGMYREWLIGPRGFPCNAPPWGALAAVDVGTGEKRWEVPLGSMSPIRGAPGAGPAIPGALNMGGPLVTGGGLVFIAASITDEKLRAFDIETGRMLWEGNLPASAQATPMTYAVNGKQYVVIAAGGHGKARSKQGDYVVAYRLK